MRVTALKLESQPTKLNLVLYIELIGDNGQNRANLIIDIPNPEFEELDSAVLVVHLVNAITGIDEGVKKITEIEQDKTRTTRQAMALAMKKHILEEIGRDFTDSGEYEVHDNDSNTTIDCEDLARAALAATAP